MFFSKTKTVKTILTQFHTAVAHLEELAARELAHIEAKSTKVKTLTDEITAHKDEAAVATSVAQKITKLTS
jgi:Mn-containing catalase